MLLSKMNYVIFKLTESCNLKCSYCSAQAVSVWQGNSMSIETFKKATDLFLEGTDQPAVNFVFHGGEPLIMPVAWLKEALDYSLLKASERGKRMIFSMQSNGTVFNEKVVELIKHYKIGISTSLDGTPEMNDKLRQRGSRVVDNIQKFRAAGIDLAVITLVNRNNHDKFPEIISYFLENGIKAVKVNPYYAVGNGHGMEPINAQELFGAKKALLDHMIETDLGGVVDVNLVHEVINFASRRQNRQSTLPTCRDKFCAGGITMAGVNPKGDVYPCVRSVGLNESWLLWNLHEGIREDEYKKRLNAFHAKDLHYMGCENCEASRICTHGCTAFAKSSAEGDELECHYTKKMYRYFQERREEIYALYELIIANRRQRQAPSKSATEQPNKATIPAVAATAMHMMASEFTGLHKDIDLELLGRQGPALLYRFEKDHFIFHSETKALSKLDKLAYRIARDFHHLHREEVRTELETEFNSERVNFVIEKMEKIIGQSVKPVLNESYQLI